jgi:preprotein translocase subunit SecG
MFGLVIFIHVLVCVILIVVVLFQQPQKGGVTSVFGGGESVFGGGGAAPFMTRLTSGLAILFMITSLTLVLLSARRARPSAGGTSPRATEQAPTQEAPLPGGK